MYLIADSSIPHTDWVLLESICHESQVLSSVESISYRLRKDKESLQRMGLTFDDIHKKMEEYHAFISDRTYDSFAMSKYISYADPRDNSIHCPICTGLAEVTPPSSDSDSDPYSDPYSDHDSYSDETEKYDIDYTFIKVGSDCEFVSTDLACHMMYYHGFCGSEDSAHRFDLESFARFFDLTY